MTTDEVLCPADNCGLPMQRVEGDMVGASAAQLADAANATLWKCPSRHRRYMLPSGDWMDFPAEGR